MRDAGGATPAVRALDAGCGDNGLALVRAGADPLAEDNSGASALGLAAVAGEADVVKEMLATFPVIAVGDGYVLVFFFFFFFFFFSRPHIWNRKLALCVKQRPCPCCCFFCRI
jgi:hypothetical protein